MLQVAPQWLLAPPPPTPHPPSHSKLGSVILAYRQQLQSPHPSIVVAKWWGWGMLNFFFFLGGGELFDSKAITYIPSVFFGCLFFLIIILDFVFIDIQHFASNL